jgi:hypothetical protein
MPSIETSVASLVFHERITLSPGFMLFGVALMVAVGAVPLSAAAGGGGGGGGAAFLPHPAKAASTATARQEAARRRRFHGRTGSGFTVFSSIKNIGAAACGAADSSLKFNGRYLQIAKGCRQAA